MNVPLVLGAFALIAFPVMFIVWTYDTTKDAIDRSKLPPEKKQEIKQFRKSQNAELRQELKGTIFTPFTIFGLAVIAVAVIVIALGNR